MRSFLKNIQRQTTQPVQQQIVPIQVQTINNNTMFNNVKITWEWVFSLLGLITSAGLVVLFFIYILSPKTTMRYSLGVSGESTITITKEINWYADDEIKLDRSISYNEAIRLVDSLNKTLK